MGDVPFQPARGAPRSAAPDSDAISPTRLATYGQSHERITTTRQHIPKCQRGLQSPENRSVSNSRLAAEYSSLSASLLGTVMKSEITLNSDSPGLSFRAHEGIPIE